MPARFFQPALLMGRWHQRWCPVCVLTALNLIHGQDIGDDSMLGETTKALLADSWEWYRPVEDAYGFLGIRKNKHYIFAPYFGVNKDT